MPSLSMTPLLRRFLLPSQTSLHHSIQQLPSLHTPLQLPAHFQPKHIPQFLIPLAATTFSNLAGFLSTLWDSILLAVPKKRTPYSKKRSRQLAGKGLKDLTNLNHCSACGRVKRMHILCPHCVQNIKDMWAGRLTGPGGESQAEYRRKNPLSKSTELVLKKK